MFLDGDEQFRHRLIEAPIGKKGAAYDSERCADADARTEAERLLDMLDREIVLARPTPEDAVDVPAAGVVRI